jgi:hypothetical protein
VHSPNIVTRDITNMVRCRDICFHVPTPLNYFGCACSKVVPQLHRRTTPAQHPNSHPCHYQQPNTLALPPKSISWSACSKWSAQGSTADRAKRVMCDEQAQGSRPATRAIFDTNTLGWQKRPRVVSSSYNFYGRGCCRCCLGQATTLKATAGARNGAVVWLPCG